MISKRTIQEAVELLKKAANPVKIILFGSYARGDIKESSDLDFLVVEKEIKARRMETLRLRDVLSPLRTPVDLLVVSEKSYNEWKDAPGTTFTKQLSKGRWFMELLQVKRKQRIHLLIIKA